MVIAAVTAVTPAITKPNGDILIVSLNKIHAIRASVMRPVHRCIAAANRYLPAVSVLVHNVAAISATVSAFVANVANFIVTT